MDYRAMSEDEKRWRRRDDARILAQAEEIKADKERLGEARRGAKEILAEEAERLKGLSKIVHNPTVSKAVSSAERSKKKEEDFNRVFGKNNPATIGRFF